ncbi:MAG: DUF523 domain-containing protein [Candidatus Auribacterota bacterium]|nr:DUF523 domain-containing protein [Candidatus Auribacterota bacterium]
MSACLIGCPCRYDAKNALVREARNLFEQGFLFPVCPEIMAGLPVPRRTITIHGESGFAVLDGKARVIDSENNDLTDRLITSAMQCVAITEKFNISKALLKSKSPSCGVHQTYCQDGLIFASGLTAAALKRNGIQIFDETCDLNTVLYEK